MGRPLVPALAVAVVFAIPAGAWAVTVTGTRGPNRIAVHGNGSTDTVRCLGGVDIVTADLGDHVSADCEIVSRRLSRDLTTDFRAQHETQVEPDSLSVGRTIVTAFQSGRFSGGGAAAIGWATSRDAARTWRSGVLPSRWERVSDPVVAFDAVHGLWLIGLLGIEDGVVDVLVARSADGVSWELPAVAVDAVASDEDYDKEWIACDNWPASRFRGRCYLSYLAIGSGRLETRSSTDGGRTWSEAVETSVGVSTSLLLNGAFPVVRPDGTLVVGFTAIAPIAGGGSDNWIGASRSVDGGATFAAARRVAGLDDQPVLGMRAPVLPSMDVDATGRVYVIWSDCRFRFDCIANDALIASSPDGVAWTAPIRLPAGPLSSRVDHFTPAIAADPARPGRIAVAYYSFRQPDGCELEDCAGLDVSLSTSSDGGLHWAPPVRLNATSMRLGWLADGGFGQMLGDYISVSWLEGHPVPVFALSSAPLGFDLLRQSILATTTTP